MMEMPGLGNLREECSLWLLVSEGSVIMAVREWRNRCGGGYTGTLHPQLDRHRKGDLKQNRI